MFISLEFRYLTSRIQLLFINGQFYTVFSNIWKTWFWSVLIHRHFFMWMNLVRTKFEREHTKKCINSLKINLYYTVLVTVYWKCTVSCKRTKYHADSPAARSSSTPATSSPRRLTATTWRCSSWTGRPAWWRTCHRSAYRIRYRPPRPRRRPSWPAGALRTPTASAGPRSSRP